MLTKTISRLFFAAWAVIAIPVLLWADPQTADPPFWQWAPTPPMGWNSWDSFGAGVWESNVIANADYMARHLKSHGWNIITIDIQWYEPLAHSTAYRRRRGAGDGCQRATASGPEPFPMTAATRSFKPIGDYLHVERLEVRTASDARHSAPGREGQTTRSWNVPTPPPTSPTPIPAAHGTRTCMAWI